MDPPSSLPEKTNKKVSRACNTCRLKRKKCNGLDPCLFCTENKIECSYSREPRRRGPPSGYLRYTETRVALFEILLGLFISRMGPTPGGADPADPFIEVAQTLLAESKCCTQDVWDAHRRAWTVCKSAKIINELAITFAPYSQRSDHEVAAKPLLPPVHPTLQAKTPDPSPSPSANTASPAPMSAGGLSSDTPVTWRADTPGVRLDQGALDFSPTTRHGMSRESFERGAGSSVSSQALQQGPLASQPWSFSQPRLEIPVPDYPYSPTDRRNKAGNISHSSAYSLDSHPMTNGIHHSQTLTPSPSVNGNHLVTHFEQDTSYAGSYWRSVELSMSDSPDYSPSSQDNIYSLPQIGVELPPPHILSKMIDAYYVCVHPSFPILPSRGTVESLLSSVPVQTEGFTTVLLAVCAYCGRLVPSSNDGLDAFAGVGEAGKVAADLWYEQARTAVNACLRKGSSVESIQTLLLLALCDHGKGNESQAWLLVGMAVRAGQDIDLNGNLPVTYTKSDLPPEEIRLRKNIWGASLMLDLFLSLQLGRPPAAFDCLRSPPLSTQYESSDCDLSKLPIQIFQHAVSLCTIISRINLHLYLGFSTLNMQTLSEKLATLKGELQTWQQLLPAEFRISIGHQQDRAILELNMLYHIAVILLYRPFCRDNTIPHAIETVAEAASAFNTLLDKYKLSQNEIPTSSPPLSQTNPNMVYIIFTAAIAHISGYKMHQPQQNAAVARTAAKSLQTQLHLLSCLEALTTIGITWGLARRCWKTLNKLMDVEGLKSDQNLTTEGNTGLGGLGKRKRDGDDKRARKARETFDGGTADAGLRGRLSNALPGVSINPNMDPHTLSSFEPSSNDVRTAITLRHPQPPSPAPVSWNVAPATLSYDAFGMPAPALSAELFNSHLSVAPRWSAETQESDSIGLGMVWKGEWDERLWTRTLNLGSNANG